jgi:ETC complex I subunit conserved region
MMVRIYRPARNAMQSGKARTKAWVAEFDQASARTTDPLMGWTSSRDTNQQVKLSFDNKEEAIAWAERKGYDYRVFEPPAHRAEKKAYADNFKWGRPENWTH